MALAIWKWGWIAGGGAAGRSGARVRTARVYSALRSQVTLVVPNKRRYDVGEVWPPPIRRCGGAWCFQLVIRQARHFVNGLTVYGTPEGERLVVGERGVLTLHGRH